MVEAIPQYEDDTKRGRKQNNVLKKPPNGFFLFCNAKRSDIVAKNPAANALLISQILSSLWNKFNPSVRDQYKTEAANLYHEFKSRPALTTPKLDKLKPGQIVTPGRRFLETMNEEFSMNHFFFMHIGAKNHQA